MILIITYKQDYTADYIINKLNNKGVKYFRLNCEDILTHKISIDFDNSSIKTSVDTITIFDSVWFRRVTLPILDLNISKAEYSFYYSEMESFLSNLWIMIKSEKWLSTPNAVYQAENKLYQLQVAKSLGFNIPRTLVSYNYAEINSFFKDCKEDIIIKPLNAGFIEESLDKCGQIFTTKITKDKLRLLKESVPLPSIYQENIAKKIEIRVTVVDTKVFAAYVDSQSQLSTSTDWRREKLIFYPFELPKDIIEKCISLVRKLDLNFGAIDLIQKPNGDFVFLEINPNGQWVWIETDTGLKISDAIIDFLTTKQYSYHYREGVSQCHLETLNEISNNEEQRGQSLEAKLSTLINNSGIILALISFIVPLLYEYATKIDCLFRLIVIWLFLGSLSLIIIGIFIASKTLNSKNFTYYRISANSVLMDNGNKCEFIRDKISFIESHIKENTETNNNRANILIKAQRCFRYGLLLIGILSLVLSIVIFYF